jgi:hypothetical protein
MPNEPDKYQEDFDKRLVDTNSELETTRNEKADLEEKVSELQVSLANAHNAQVDLECTVTANKVRCSVSHLLVVLYIFFIHVNLTQEKIFS